MYLNFKDGEGNKYGSFEVFYIGPHNESEGFMIEGWYWWACFPGCLPDGDPQGPFKSEQEAIDNAQENA